MVRPVQYDKEQVINQAMNLFWSNGYADSNVDLLVATTGLNKHSFYGTFGGKQGLFVASLEHYLEKHAYHHLKVFDDNQGLGAIERFLRSVFSQNTENSRNGTENDFDDKAKGCLFVNTAIEVGTNDPAVSAIINSYYELSETRLKTSIKQGQKSNEIKASLNADATAKCLLAMIRGANVSRKIQPEQKDLSVRTILALLTY